MRYTADSLGMTHEVEHWTQELALKLEETPYGRLSHWDLPGEVIRSEMPLPTHDSWQEISYYQGTQSPETFERLKLHSDEFLKRQGFERVEGRYRILKHTEDQVAVFCHGGFGLTWLAHLLELPLALVWSGFWMPPSSVTTILFDERSQEWAVPVASASVMFPICTLRACPSDPVALSPISTNQISHTIPKRLKTVHRLKPFVVVI